ncbi:MAG TPA: hypothetical protein VGP73_17815 [Thermoanaerobaculia bacterium]
MGLSLMALSASRGSADPSCQTQCQTDYAQCQQICNQNPCFVSCDTNLQNCLAACPS